MGVVGTDEKDAFAMAQRFTPHTKVEVCDASAFRSVCLHGCAHLLRYHAVDADVRFA
jgi:hypothetical protein